MSPQATGPRVGELPAGQAGLLDRIHALSGQAAQLRRAARDSGGDVEAATAVLERLRTVDRDRELTEIHARANGMPANWIDHVRRLGQAGQPFTHDHRLPPPARPPGRATASRVLHDTRHMREMAAAFVTREHLLARDGVPEPDPAAAQQFDRNMHALWTRATRTADAIGMSGQVRARTFQVGDEDLHAHITEFASYSPADLDTVWRRHAAVSIAASVRRSLSSLRRIKTGPDTTTAHPDHAQPPAPATLIERARETLHLVHAHLRSSPVGSEQPDTGREIETAVADATPHGALDTENTAPDTEHEPSVITAAEHGLDL